MLIQRKIREERVRGEGIINKKMPNMKKKKTVKTERLPKKKKGKGKG